MKAKIMVVAALVMLPLLGFGQKFAFVDTEYILNKIASYKSAREQVDKLSKQYQSEVEQGYADVEKMVKDLQEKYFGREGALQKKQEELIKPIQDQVYQAVKDVATEGGYAAIIDVAASGAVLYSSPRYDKSDEVLKRMGY